MAAIRILLVDDHQLVRNNLRNLLATDADFVVVSEASSGFEAVRKAQEFHPDVVLLDVSIPDLNGLQAAPLIKKIAPNTEILFCHAVRQPILCARGIYSGCSGFLNEERRWSRATHRSPDGAFEEAIR